MSDWIIKVTGANMPASCRSRYSVVRVLEVPKGVEDVSSCRSKQVIRIVYESRPVPHAGTTERSGKQQVLAKARAIVAGRAAEEAKALAARREVQAMIVGKLERGERLTEREYASL